MERLTITLPGDMGKERRREIKIKQPLGSRMEERLVASTHEFWKKWEDWCFEPDRRATALLDEYAQVYGALVELGAGATPLRPTLSRLVGSKARLTFGAWSCEMPSNWKTRCAQQDSPSEWAEFFLSLKHRTNIRDIKQRLAGARSEKRIVAAWEAYGRWLWEHPLALADLTQQLGIHVASPAERHAVPLVTQNLRQTE